MNAYVSKTKLMGSLVNMDCDMDLVTQISTIFIVYEIKVAKLWGIWEIGE